MNAPASNISTTRSVIRLRQPSYQNIFPSPLVNYYTSGERKFRRITLEPGTVTQARREFRSFARRLSISDLCALRKALKKGELNECVQSDSFVGTIIRHRKIRHRTRRLQLKDYNHIDKGSDLMYWFKQHVGRQSPVDDDYVATTIFWLDQIIKERRAKRKLS